MFTHHSLVLCLQNHLLHQWSCSVQENKTCSGLPHTKSHALPWQTVAVQLDRQAASVLHPSRNQWGWWHKNKKLHNLTHTFFYCGDGVWVKFFDGLSHISCLWLWAFWNSLSSISSPKDSYFQESSACFSPTSSSSNVKPQLFWPVLWTQNKCLYLMIVLLQISVASRKMVLQDTTLLCI